MKHTDIKVLVVGSAGTGKSAIVDEITRQLNSIGIQTAAKHIDQNPSDAFQQNRKLGCLIEKGVKVEVTEVQALRDGSIPSRLRDKPITFHDWYCEHYGFMMTETPHYKQMRDAWNTSKGNL